MAVRSDSNQRKERQLRNRIQIVQVTVVYPTLRYAL
jgi:hypothetical protein